MAEKTSFTCGESICISDVASLHQRLQKSLQKSSTIELKADAVQKADTAGLQLFISLALEVSAIGGGLIWKKPSKPLVEAARTLGVEKQLGLQA